MKQNIFSGSTGFGWIELNGARYEKDIIIHTDGRISKRKKGPSKPLRSHFGHTPLGLEEISFIDDEEPDIVYIATGQHGSLPLTDESVQFLNSYQTRIGKTPDIFLEILEERRKYVAVIHLTC